MPSLNSPILTGDVSGGLHTTTVDKLKGQPVATTAPTSGQVLTWDGTQWAPATNSTGGGGGANGLTYYLNQSTDADAPVTGIPGTPKQLGRTGQTTQVDVTTGTLTADTWTLVAGFVSETTPQDPATILIPAGLWDFNVWALGVADQNHSNSIRARAYIYNGTTLTALGTSAVQTITETSAQYGLSMLVEQTTILATDRIYVAIEALATANGHTVTAQFGDNTPSHVHTSLPLVGGTGLWRSISGVLQPNGTQILDSDVASDAAIAQSKIASLTTDLGNKAGTAQVDVYATAGTFTWTKPVGAKTVNIQLLAGGGGGGSGRFSSTAENRSGGGGGGGGSYLQVTVPAAALDGSESVTVGAGGAGAPPQTTLGSNGQNGSAGGNTTFNSLIATGGGGGTGGTTTAGGGGYAGLNSNSGGSASTTGGAGGVGAPIALTVIWNYGGAGGGGGGGVNASNTPSGGGIGGRSVALGFTGGAAGTVGNPGSAGTTNTSATAGLIAVGSGGGGGGGATGQGATGGAGGFPSSGGGGGGVGTTTSSGGGGAGASGMAVITTYF